MKLWWLHFLLRAVHCTWLLYISKPLYGVLGRYLKLKGTKAAVKAGLHSTRAAPHLFVCFSFIHLQTTPLLQNKNSNNKRAPLGMTKVWKRFSTTHHTSHTFILSFLHPSTSPHEVELPFSTFTKLSFIPS